MELRAIFFGLAVTIATAQFACGPVKQTHPGPKPKNVVDPVQAPGAEWLGVWMRDCRAEADGAYSILQIHVQKDRISVQTQIYRDDQCTGEDQETEARAWSYQVGENLSEESLGDARGRVRELKLADTRLTLAARGKAVERHNRDKKYGFGDWEPSKLKEVDPRHDAASGRRIALGIQVDHLIYSTRDMGLDWKVDSELKRMVTID